MNQTIFPSKSCYRFLTIFLLCSFVQLIVIKSGNASNTEETNAVIESVDIFFETMKSKNVNLASKVVMPDARFIFVSQQDGVPIIKYRTGQEHLDSLSETKHNLRERLWNRKVRIQDAIATLWASYDFWIDDKFSHCGIDAFQLIRIDDSWIISGGSFTVETNCKVSPLGPLKQ